MEQATQNVGVAMAHQAKPMPNLVSAVDSLHGAATNVEQVMGQLESKLGPVLSPDQNQTQASNGGQPIAAPSSGLLHDYIQALEKRLYNLESRATSILTRLHL